MSDIGPWLEANQSNLIAAVVLLGVGALLAIMLRVLAVRVISAIERAVPGRSFRTSLGGRAGAARLRCRGLCGVLGCSRPTTPQLHERLGAQHPPLVALRTPLG
jgi:hypothetical protein